MVPCGSVGSPLLSRPWHEESGSQPYKDQEWNRSFPEVICEEAHLFSGDRERRMINFRIAWAMLQYHVS